MKWFLIVLVLIICGCLSKEPAPEESDFDKKVIDEVGLSIMELKSVFEEGQPIPKKYTCDGENINPPIEFINVPDGTKTLALIVDDPDAPAGTWVHWVIFNIPSDKTKIGENKITGTEGINSFEKVAYGGPCPPNGQHRYFFRGYALSEGLTLKKGSTRFVLETYMKDKVIAQATLMGVYSR